MAVFLLSQETKSCRWWCSKKILNYGSSRLQRKHEKRIYRKSVLLYLRRIWFDNIFKVLNQFQDVFWPTKATVYRNEKEKCVFIDTIPTQIRKSAH